MSQQYDDQPVYMISIAAKLAGMHPQTLRIYERKKLVNPGRTPKSTRLYSRQDIEQLKYIQKLTQEEGVNLAGVKIIIDLKKEIAAFQAEIEQLKQALAKQMEELQAHVRDETEKVHRRYRRELVLLPKGPLQRRVKF